MSNEWVVRDGSLLDPPARLIKNLRTDKERTGIVEVDGIPINFQTIDFTYCCVTPPESDEPECYCVLGRDEFEKFCRQYPKDEDERDEEALKTLLARLKAWKYGHTASKAGRLYERLYSTEFGSSCSPRSPDDKRSQELLEDLDDKMRGLITQPPDDPVEADALRQLRCLSHQFVREYCGDKITVYRGMGADLGNVANQILSNRVPKKYHIDTPVLLSTSLHQRTAEEYSPLVMRVNVEVDNVGMAPDFFSIVEKDGDYRTEAELQIEGDAIQAVDRKQIRAHEVGFPLHQVIKSAFKGTTNSQVHVAMAGIVESLVENRSNRLVAREEVNLDQSTKQQLRKWVEHFTTQVEEYDKDQVFKRDIIDFVEQAVTAVCDNHRKATLADGGSDSTDESLVSIDLTQPRELEQISEDRGSNSIRLTERVEKQEIQHVARRAFRQEVAVAIRQQNEVGGPLYDPDLNQKLAERLINADAEQEWQRERIKAAESLSDEDIDAIRDLRERVAKWFAYDKQELIELVLGVDRLALLEDYAEELAEVTAKHPKEWIPDLSNSESTVDREGVLFEALEERTLDWQNVHLTETIDLLRSDTPLEEIYDVRVHRVARRIMFDTGIEAFRNNVRNKEPSPVYTDPGPTHATAASSANELADYNEGRSIRSQEFVNIDEIDPLDDSVDRDRDDRYLVLFSARPKWKHEALTEIVSYQKKLTEQPNSAESSPTALSAFWGLTERKRQIATELRSGDLALFYTEDHAYMYSAEVLNVEVNPDLLDTVGLCDIQTSPRDPENRGESRVVPGNHCVYAVYLTNLRPVMIPSKELHQRLGDTIDYLNHSARLIENDRLDPLTDFYGDLPSVIDALDEQ